MSKYICSQCGKEIGHWWDPCICALQPKPKPKEKEDGELRHPDELSTPEKPD